MTREEAIIRLKEGEPFSEIYDPVWDEALNMAISALSEDGEYVKKGDAISKILIEFTERESNGKVMCACADVKQTCADILDGLPSYSFPYSENKGEWIEVVEEKFPNGEKRIWHYECSDCGSGEPCCPINKEHWDFCPNCGADMREPKGEKGTE